MSIIFHVSSIGQISGFRLGLGVFMLALLTPLSLSARELTLDPTVSISFGYDDNPGLSEEVIDSAEMTSAVSADTRSGSQNYVAVGGNLSLESRGQTDLYAALFSVEARRYDSTLFDTDLASASLEYAKQLEKSSYDLGLSYLEQSSLEAAFSDIDINLVGSTIEQTETGVSAGYAATINRQLSSVLGISYRDVGFEGDSETVSDLVEFEETVLSVDFTNSFSERFDILVGAELVDYRPTNSIEPAGSGDEQALGFSVGFEYALKENIQVGMSIAPTFIDTAVIGEGPEPEDTSTQYNVELGYSGFQSNYNASFGRSVSPSASGGFSEIDSISIAWTRPSELGRGFSLVLSAGEESGDSVTSENRSFQSIDAGYGRRINRNLEWGLNYRYRTLDTADSDDVDSNTITLVLIYNRGRRVLSGFGE